TWSKQCLAPQPTPSYRREREHHVLSYRAPVISSNFVYGLLPGGILKIGRGLTPVFAVRQAFASPRKPTSSRTPGGVRLQTAATPPRSGPEALEEHASLCTLALFAEEGRAPILA